MNVILDLDTGIDDAMALAYAIGNKEMNVIGVCGTYGNVYTHDGGQNVLNLLEMLQIKNVPVYVGESHAIAKNAFERLEVSARIHGENGVGQIILEKAERELEKIGAVEYLLQTIGEYGKELTIICTGPLTNLASVILKKPDIKDRIGKVIIMGGALSVPGNVTPYTEANIFQDPEAAKIVFESGIDVTMVGLDVTQRSQLTKEDTNVFRSCGSKAAKAYADMIDYYIAQHEHSCGTACYLHDPSAAVCAVHPEYFHMVPLYMSVVTQGEARGRTIGDASKLRLRNPNVKVCVGVDSEALENELKQTFMALFSESK